jgi:hypothetical protein
MLYFGRPVSAQELNCLVTINFDQLVAQQKTDEQTMSQLNVYVTDFLNSTRWTNDQFTVQERIKCKLNINLTRSAAQGSYEANAQFVVTRPVYQSSYESILISFVDRAFNFNFLPNNPMFFNENTYTDELPFLLAFYANIALALDYDSFGKLGGNPFIQRAFNMANIAQNASPFRAWRQGDIRNRFALIENLNNQQFLQLREASYQYHRQGLDLITQRPDQTRKNALEMLNTIKQVSQQIQASIFVNSLMDGKAEELYNILSEAGPEERRQAFSLLTSVDPGKTELYRRLIN